MSISKHPLAYAVSGLAKDMRRLSLRFRLYSSWKEAAQQANYENDDLLEYRVRKAEMMLKEGRYRQFDTPGINHLRLGSLWLKSVFGHVNILDFGGSFGEEGMALISDPLLCENLNYLVCESPGVRKRVKELAMPPQLQFVDDLTAVENCDLFYSACALPYVEEPAWVLEQALRLRPYLIILVRNCFSERELIRVQASRLFNNGPQGIDVPGFKNAVVRYPHHTQSMTAIRGQLESQNYRLVGSYANDDGIYPYGNEVFGRDLIFADLERLAGMPRYERKPADGQDG